MKTYDDIFTDISNRFESKANDSIAEGSVVEFYTAAVAESMAAIYQDIEDNKNPHIWSKLYGEQLDDMGVMLNCARKEDENDISYRYRLMNWVLSNEASNKTAISDALLNPEYASNIEFVPYTKGSGTASCYIIPKSYDEDIIEKACVEAENIIKKIANPSLYVEYIIPTAKPVTLQIYISSGKGDLEAIKKDLETRISLYINTIAPKDYLDIGYINKLGVNTSCVDYFSVLSIIIDDVVYDSIKILQGLDTKMIYDKINWITD